MYGQYQGTSSLSIVGRLSTLQCPLLEVPPYFNESVYIFYMHK